MYLLASSFAAALPVERRVSACWGWVGEISSLFEHPEVILVSALSFSQPANRYGCPTAFGLSRVWPNDRT